MLHPMTFTLPILRGLYKTTEFELMLTCKKTVELCALFLSIIIR